MDEIQADRPPNAPPRMQFSLRTMLLVTTGVAVACAVIFTMPSPVAMPIVMFVNMLLPAVLTTILIYGSSYQRTFCIGALFPSATFFYMSGELGGYAVSGLFGSPIDDEVFWFRVTTGGFWLASFVVGFLCVVVRRLVEKQQSRANLARSEAGDEKRG